jgi:hypothetical protein
MVKRHTRAWRIALSVGVMTLPVACAPTQIGPTVQASAGPGKTLDQYQADATACKTFAGNDVAGMQNASNIRAVDALLNNDPSLTSTAAGDHQAIQQQYDNSYAQCMVSKGETVVGFASAAPAQVPVATRAPPDPVVRATQTELIRLGYLKDAADVYSGPRTQGAIRAFESASALPVDGSASPRLLARLQATPTSSGAAASAAPPPSGSPGWVAPTTGGTAAASAKPVAPAGWVTPGSSSAPPPKTP